MTGRTTILVLLVAAVAVVGASQLGREEPQPTDARLQARVNSYYVSLKNQRFEETWRFLSAGLRRDNPQEEYAKSLRTAHRSIDVIGEPKVSGPADRARIVARAQGATGSASASASASTDGGSAKTAGEAADEEKAGSATATVRLTGLDGKPVQVTHTTFWKWGVVQSNPPDWYLVREQMKEGQPVTGR
jgi:hypothetical protein